MFTQPYFSPMYFPPPYFSPPGAGAVVLPPTQRRYRDGDAFAAILAALEGTREFADVVLGTTAERAALGADRVPIALVFPGSWDEEDDADPITNVRHVAYTITLVCRDEDPMGRYQQLDRLTSIIQDALEGSDLDGGCLPALTRVRRGRYLPSSHHPELRVVLSGTFTYLTSARVGQVTTA